jgi:hypothetical protein
MSNYISESLSPSEVFRQFGDQVPEFMQTWLEQIVNKAQDAEEVYAVFYKNSSLDLEVDSLTLAEDLDTMETQSAAYDDLKEEIANLEDQVTDLEKENKDYRKLLNDNGIEY